MKPYTPQIEVTEFVLIGKNSSIGKRICLHPVKNEILGAEIPFTKESAKKIFSLFENYKYEKKDFEGLIPNEIIYAKDSINKGLQLVWSVKKGNRKLFYSEENEKQGLLTKEYLLPTLIFKYSNKSLSVFAMVDNERINADSELYQAPFFNVNSYGNVCMGNVNINLVEKFKTFDKCKDFLENSFFNSFFTHSNSDNITKDYLLSLEMNKVFNNKNLIKTNYNLTSIL